MPMIVDAAEQRRRIRDAARRVFSARGIATTGLGHVAAAAGMRRSRLYHYYPDKKALVRDLADELLAEEEAIFEAALAEEGSAVERIERLTASVADLFDRRASLGRLLLETWASDPSRVRRALRRVRGSIAALIRSGQEQGEIDARLDPDAVAVLVIGLMDGLMLQIFLDPKGVQLGPRLRSSLVQAVRRTLAP